MAPTDKIRAPFRWIFLPVEEPSDKSIHWTWRAYSQAGLEVSQSTKTFESREDCIEDAKKHGFSPGG